MKSLSIPEAARTISASPQYVRDLIDCGIVDAYHRPTAGKGERKHLRIRSEDWDTFLGSWKKYQPNSPRNQASNPGG